MELPLSQLISARFRQVPGSRHLIALHRHNEFLEATRQTGLAINPEGSVTGLQASKGVYIGRTIVGYTWFIGPLDQPSPVHFGDAMQEIERFLWDEIDRAHDEEPALPFLVGAEQGAIMALAMAAAVPDLLSGVIAIDAAFPVVPGWDPPLVPLKDLPVLLVNPRSPDRQTQGVLTGDELIATFRTWGANVNVIETPADAGPERWTPVANWLSQQEVNVRR